MKDQYFADIGDYGKYGLLRFIAQQGIQIAVNWYMTLDDDPPTRDGHFRDYLENDQYRDCDKDLFDELKKMHNQKQYSVETFEEKRLIPNARYYHERIDSKDWKQLQSKDKLSQRLQWHSKAIASCKGAELVFLDPDNGLSQNKINGWQTARKYVFLDEAYDYYKAGSDIVYYCHKGRRTYSKWMDAINSLKTKDPDIHIRAITYRKGTQRTYVFAVHPEKAMQYDDIIKRFLETDWGKDNLFVPEV